MTSVHIEKFPLEANPGDPVSIAAYPRRIGIPWQHNIEGEPIQRRQLARDALTFQFQEIQVIPNGLSRVRMENTWEAKWQRSRQRFTIFCRFKKKIGRTKEARGGDDVTLGRDFLNGDFGEHLLKHLRIMVTVLARFGHCKAVFGFN